MADLGINEVKWTEEMLPELVWLALLDHIHDEKGAEVARLTARAARTVHKSASRRWFALLGEYAVLDDAEREGFLEELDRAAVLRQLRDGLRSLAMFYPDNPLQFLFRDETFATDPNALGELKTLVGALFDRAGAKATRAQAHALYLAFDGGLFKVSPGSRLAHFPEVQHYPSTEESRMVGGLVRASISNLFLVEGRGPTPWSALFWARGLELEPCAVADDE
jgi:hypothetical protein